MRRKSFLLGVIFSLLSLTMQAQVYEVFRQGFEANETANYTVTSGTATPQTAYSYGGARALKMSHTATQCVVTLDEIDMSNYAQLNYFTLEFAHINNVSPFNTANSIQVAMIEAKLSSSSTWTRLTSTYYDKTGSYSDYFDGSGYFGNTAYPDWSGTAMDATWWKTERFNLDRMFNNVSAANRKLNIRITLYPKTSNTSAVPADQGWYLDDIVVKASSQAIVKPVITMVKYPDLVNHPSSRGALVVVDAKAGASSLQINPDSVYILYKIGSNNTVYKQKMNPVAGVNNRYQYFLPFEGYDTLMSFRVVAKDASANENTNTSPASEAAWYQYRCIRGKANSGFVKEAATQTLIEYPFPANATAKSEFVIDSATMANAGFGPGGITSLGFMIKSGLQSSAQTRANMQIRMKNAYSTYVTSTINEFTQDYLHTVYSGSITFPLTVNNNPFTLQLQDTFFYAGKDLIVEVIQHNGNDLPGNVGVAGYPAMSGKQTLYNSDNSFMGYNPYTATEYRTAMNSDAKTPNVKLTTEPNPPLIHDCGVTSIEFPSASASAQANTNQQVRVVLKNLGVAALNAVTLYYQLDDNPIQSYNWTGNLAANATQTVTMTSSQQFTPGYHSLVAWVDDTVTSGTSRYRDHEPYNDTAYCEFIACAGPMTGTRQIGGTNADFEDMHEFLFALSSCGISNGLTVKLAPGTYEAFTMPQFTGGSASSYLTIEPLSGQVVFESNSTESAAVANIAAASYVRFNNITFRSNDADNTCTYLVQMGPQSNYNQFLNCTFTNGTANSASMINSANANNLLVSGCTFNGGTIGVDLSGMSINQRSSGNKVEKSTFNGQGTYGVYVYNQNGAEVDSNYFNNIQSGAGYAVLLQNAYGATKVTRNKIYTSHGAAAIGASGVNGTVTDYSVIANNMIVVNDDGTAISIVSPINIQSASYVKVVYNSMKFSAEDRSDIAAASFGGVAIDHCLFKNNILAVYDENNYALSYIPGSNTTNEVDGNIYYTQGSALCRYGAITYNNITAWRAAVPGDVHSQKVNPSFLNGSLVDLRTFNQGVKNIAVPVAGVTTDMFGTSRPTTPCCGAFEFDALFHDFEIIEVVSPFGSYCGNTSAIPLTLKLYNWGTTTFVPSASNIIRICYQYGNITDSVALTQSIIAGDTTLVNTGRTLNLPANGLEDAIHHIRMWVSCSQDPNNTNDTTSCTIESNYVMPAPTAINVNVPYQTPATITATAGVMSWPIYANSNIGSMPSTIYWYETATSDSVLAVGNTFVSDTLRNDTVFYFRQSRELPLMRISEVAFDNNYTSATSTVVGSTNPRPAWLSTATKVAVELTNVGDYPADLFGDTIKLVSTNNTFNNKVFSFNRHIVVQPGQSIVIQYRNSGVDTSNISVTIPTTTAFGSAAHNLNASPATAGFGVLYFHNGMKDAVATAGTNPSNGNITDITTATAWTSQNVPTHLWNGTGIEVNNTNAGISRVAWASSTTSDSKLQWRAATNANPMTLGTTNSNLILYTSNGCETPRATANVTMTNVPTIDLAVELEPMAGGCGLGDEYVSARVYNYGISACPEAYVCYSVNGVLMETDTIASIAAGGSLLHTFATPINMHQATNTIFNIKAYVVRNSSELANTITNDTSRISVESLRTPAAPTASPVSGAYANTVTLTAVSANAADNLVWYSRRGVALDTTASSFVTPILYADDTFYVASIVAAQNDYIIGTGTTQSSSNNSDYSAPYATQKNYYKTQYIFTAAELTAAGVVPGAITSLSFMPSAIPANVTMANIDIAMGTTPESAFPNTTFLTGLTPVYSTTDYAINTTDVGTWKMHQFDNPFEWDGVSNVVVEFRHHINTVVASALKTYLTTAANCALGTGNNNAITATTGARNGNRPNIRFGSQTFGCVGDRTQVPVSIDGAPDYDGSIAWADTIANYSSCSPISLQLNVRNQGGNNISAYSVVLSVDGDSVDVFQGTTTIVAGDSTVVNLPAYSFSPGRHLVSAEIRVPGDTISNNNVITNHLFVRFCGGSYTIGPAESFVSITAAIDTLNVVGMDGSVVFNIASGTYTGQAALGAINGADSNHNVTFQSLSGHAEDVVLTANPTTTENYVVSIDGSQYVSLRNLTIYGSYTTGSGNNIYATALTMANCSNINIDSCIIRVKSQASASLNANAVVIFDSVRNVSFVNNTIDSGYYAVTCKNTTEGNVSDISFLDNTINGFSNRGLNLRNMVNLSVVHNRITSAATSNAKPLYGIYLAGHTGQLSIERNRVYLVDEYSGGKRGISLFNVVGTSARRAKVYNNMISCSGTGVASVVSYGLLIDSASTYINNYFNTVRLYAGANAAATRAISIGDKTDNCTNINVRDNIMANFSQGYAYYVKSTASVSSSDYNAFYSNSSAQVPKFAFWGLDMQDLPALQAANNGDQFSVVDQPYFLADDDLQVATGQYASLAEYLSMVPTDVDNNPRSMIPTPTIGAWEYERCQHDLVIVEVIEPYMPRPGDLHPTIEGKNTRIIVKIFNNGLNNENNATWSANIEGTTYSTGTRPIPTLAPREYFYDTAYVHPALGLVDTHYMHVQLTLGNGIEDCNPADNDTLTKFYLDPAYNLQVISVSITGGCEDVCAHSPVTITIKNAGLDTIPVTMPLEFGFTAFETGNVNHNIATLPTNVTEIRTLPTFLPPNQTLPIVMNNTANLYPTGVDANITVKARGWVHCQYDLHPENDTNISSQVTSKYTPQPPVGVDVHLPYATWDTLWASQQNSLVVEWYRDSNNLSSRFNNQNQYARSCHWDVTPQYFHDSTYYLRSTQQQCSSNFSEIHVFVNNPVPYDAAVQQVINPRPTGTVYAPDDTVKVRIINYGSTPLTNVPVVYQFFNGNGTQLLQQVTETCTDTIAPGETYDFAFDSLLQIPTPINAANYKLRTWTDLNNEQVRLNDTIRTIHSFVSQGPNGSYGSLTCGTEGIDITRVTFNSLNTEFFPLGYGYFNFGDYTNPEVPMLHLTRGTHDTLFVAIESNNGGSDRTGEGSGVLGVWIDYDRSGFFSSAERIADVALTVHPSSCQAAVPVTIPDSAWFGCMRMRVMFVGDECDGLTPTGPYKVINGVQTTSSTITNGAVHDYMIYMDQEAPAYDAAITRIISPRDHRVDGSGHSVQFALANKGNSPLANAVVNYKFFGPEDTTSGTITCDQVIQPGQTSVLTVPRYVFREGTTTLQLSIDALGDADPSNNAIHYEYHRFHSIILEYKDSLEDISYWYAPSGSTEYTRNLWELGTPAKASINGTVSGENAWCTDLSHTIVTGKIGNYSVLYSPIFNIRNIRPDTLTFMLNKAMSANSSLVVQFYDYDHQWQTIPIHGDTMSTWYDSEDGFGGNSNGRYVQQLYPLTFVSGDFPQDAQLRFIYKTAPGSTANTSYGDGCAIDDFRIARARTNVDVGVIDIIEPVNPRFGETTYPKVVIKNYGYETRTSINVAYRPYGSNLSKRGVWTGTLAPDDTCHFKFDSPFIISADFPDTFDICAYTVMGTDIYFNNDSACRSFALSPLTHDLSVQTFVSPLNRVVAGDSLDITVRVRNFGLDPMENISLTYSFNNGTPVTENVDFTALVGEGGLPSMEYFNYTFHRRVRASMGYMTLQAWGHYDQDIYPYNDTINLAIEGITSINDVAAVSMIADTTGHNNVVHFALTITNNGARAANDFEVGFWYDNDTTTIFRETFHRDVPLAALATTTWYFDTVAPSRTQSWTHMCGYVRLPGDNDPTNDTTCEVERLFVDLNLKRVEVEENRDTMCRVRLVVENVGNLPLTPSNRPKMAYNINGVSQNFYPEGLTIEVGREYHLEFPRLIPKSRTREYVGSGEINQDVDLNKVNNTSSIVKVVNYFEDIEEADSESGIILYQNRPNPAMELTNIDFEIPAPGQVTFYVVDVMGRMMHRQTQDYAMGANTIQFDASVLASGTYFYGIIFEGQRLMRKMVVK